MLFQNLKASKKSCLLKFSFLKSFLGDFLPINRVYEGFLDTLFKKGLSITNYISNKSIDKILKRPVNFNKN